MAVTPVDISAVPHERPRDRTPVSLRVPTQAAVPHALGSCREVLAPCQQAGLLRSLHPPRRRPCQD